MIRKFKFESKRLYKMKGKQMFLNKECLDGHGKTCSYNTQIGMRMERKFMKERTACRINAFLWILDCFPQFSQT